MKEGRRELFISKKVSFKNCKYKYGGQEIDLISSGNVASNVATLVEKKTSTSNRMATFELVGFNINDVKKGTLFTYHTFFWYRANSNVLSVLIICLKLYVRLPAEWRSGSVLGS